MKTRWFGAAVLLLGLSTAPLPAADDLSESKPYEPVSEGKPAAKAQTRRFGRRQTKVRFR